MLLTRLFDQLALAVMQTHHFHKQNNSECNIRVFAYKFSNEKKWKKGSENINWWW